MKPVWSKDVDPILSVGQPLDSVGVKNWALERRAALAALEQLSEMGVGVRGGDVYVSDGEHLRSNCDNWFCQPRRGDVPLDFVVRSIAKARSYIQHYPSTPTPSYFALVPDL